MDFNQKEITSPNISGDFNLKKTFSVYAKQWKWFVICLLFGLGVASSYLRYTAPQYLAYSKVKLISDKEGNTATEAFKDLSFFSDSDNAEIEDEIEVIKSAEIISNVIDKLNLNVQYFVQGRIYESELYRNVPITINFIASDSVIKRTDFSAYIEILSDLNFNYKLNKEDSPKKGVFGENVDTFFGGMVITPSENDFQRIIGQTIRVQITPVKSLIQYYKYGIEIYQIGKNSRIVNVSIQDEDRVKALDIVNTLIEEYNKYSIEKKNIKAKNTAKFIDDRIDLIAKELGEIDDQSENFKTGNKLTNIESEANMYLDFSSQSEQEMNASQNELNIINYLKNQVGDKNASFEPIPSNVGISDPSIAATAAKYNELLNTRQQRLKSSSEKNPIIVNLDQELNNLRNSLSQSLDNSANTIGIKVRNLQSQLQRINTKIYAVPGQTRKLRDIEREQGTMEGLYIYLLTKREEAAISLTVTSPNAIVIDEAYSSSNPIFPKNKIIFIAACFISLVIPFLIIYVNDLLDNKIHNKEDLENEIKNITVLGEIPKVKSSGKMLIESNDRSILSESFRIIRTNFEYVRRGRNVEKYDNVVFVTSTINGEGKTLFSSNFALTLASTGKKVLLLGADIRNPQIQSVIKPKKGKVVSKIGLSEYLFDKSISLGETINTYDINDIKIDILLSGKIPPNPAELLMSGRLKELFDSVSEKYDLVIVDTAPSMLVTDTLLISSYSGHTIYLTRADRTEKRILNFAKELHADKKLNGMMLVVNDVKQANFGYGAKYGYYGAPVKKSWFGRKKS